MPRLLLSIALAGISLAACGGASYGPSEQPRDVARHRHHASSKTIKHVVILVEENRSFDDFFATFPGADGTTTGEIKTSQGDKKIDLQVVHLAEPCDFGHSWRGFNESYDHGAMDGFNLEGSGKCLGKAGTRPYQYVDPSEIAPYWDIAQQYVLADHMFQTHGSGSFSSHQDLIRGATTYDANAVDSLIDSPSALPWGCDAPPGTVTSYLHWDGKRLNYESKKGPFPCTNKFASSGSYYETLRDLLDANGVSWKYYCPPTKNGVGKFWNAFDMIAAVRYGAEWKTNVTTTKPWQNTIFTDIDNNALPAVSWVIPSNTDSDHPGGKNDNGPPWVATVVNAIGESSYWDTTAIIIVWDDWGGFYDHVPPPIQDQWGGLGFRVPMLIVSPYARIGSASQGGYISHTQYEFGSILKFIEDNWNLGSLGTTDARANSIVDSFDFSQQPRPFTQIPSNYSRSYFEHQPPSNDPVDTE